MMPGNTNDNNDERLAPTLLQPGTAEYVAAVQLHESLPLPQRDALARYLDGRGDGGEEHEEEKRRGQWRRELAAAEQLQRMEEGRGGAAAGGGGAAKQEEQQQQEEIEEIV